MNNLFIIIAKYLFVFYIGFFLLQGFFISLTKEEKLHTNVPLALSNQRLMIILFHITAYLILFTVNTESRVDVLTEGILSLAFVVIGNLLVYRVYKNSSQLMWNCIFFISDIGLVMLYRLDTDLAHKQLIWLLLGFICAMLIPFMLNLLPRMDKFKNIYIAISILLLLATIIFGKEEFGSKNWISIMGFSFQPSEIIKVFFIFYIASCFSQKPTFKELIIPVILSGVLMICFVIQKDLGSVLIYFMTLLVVIYIATGNSLYFLGGMGVAGIGSVIAYFLFSHIRIRFKTWLNPWADIDSTGYQITQSLFAIGTYGLFGGGFTRCYCTKIPVVERDFIFSAICEEFGTIFAVGLILIFLIIFLEGARAAIVARSRFLSLLCAGLTAMLSFQTFTILGGVTKLIPLTGVTLPFVSYGGTSILICFITISILQWVYQNNTEYQNRIKRQEQRRKRMKQSREEL